MLRPFLFIKKLDQKIGLVFLWRKGWDSLRKALPYYHAWVAKGRCLPFVGNLYKLQSTFRLPIPTRSNPTLTNKNKT